MTSPGGPKAATGIPGPIFTSTGSTPAGAAHSIPAAGCVRVSRAEFDAGNRAPSSGQIEKYAPPCPAGPEKSGSAQPKAESPSGDVIRMADLLRHPVMAGAVTPAQVMRPRGSPSRALPPGPRLTQAYFDNNLLPFCFQ